LIAIGLALLFVGLVFGVDALKAFGVITGLIGGGFYQAVLVRADSRNSKRSRTRYERDAADERRSRSS